MRGSIGLAMFIYRVCGYLVGDVVLVEGEHCVEQPLCVRKHLLARRPVVGLLLPGGAHHGGLHLAQHTHGLEDELDARRRAGVLGHFGQVGHLSNGHQLSACVCVCIYIHIHTCIYIYI